MTICSRLLTVTLSFALMSPVLKAEDIQDASVQDNSTYQQNVTATDNTIPQINSTVMPSVTASQPATPQKPDMASYCREHTC